MFDSLLMVDHSFIEPYFHGIISKLSSRARFSRSLLGTTVSDFKSDGRVSFSFLLKVSLQKLKI